MTTHVTPYLGFAGDARAAMEFYRSVFGGDLEIVTASDLDPTARTAPDRVEHASLTAASGFTLMGSDTGAEHQPRSNLSVALAGEDGDEITGFWRRLVEDGTVSAPLARSPWGALFGRCTDRFGTAWLVTVPRSDR